MRAKKSTKDNFEKQIRRHLNPFGGRRHDSQRMEVKLSNHLIKQTLAFNN